MRGEWGLKEILLWLADKDSEEYKELQAEKARLRATKVQKIEEGLEEERPTMEVEMKKRKKQILGAI